jgi:hypothetical protein
MADETPVTVPPTEPPITWESYPAILRWSAGALLAWDIAALAVLTWLLLARFLEWWNVDELPNPMGGMLPLIVPWAGALGGVAISLVGLSRHFGAWGPTARKTDVAATHPGFAQRIRWNAWHVTRFFVGAVFGSVASLIVAFVFGSLGATDAGTLDPSPLGTATLFAVSFIVGYRDRTFRDLADRVIDTLFGPGQTDDKSVSFDLSDSVVDLGEVKVNSHLDKQIEITNNASRVLRIDMPTVTGTGFSIPGANRITLASQGTEKVDVRFAPTAVGESTGALVIKAGGVEKTVSLKATAIA